ncbi:hypothetical protein [Streptomyces sp. ST2-7A]|uniref:hypothetical protein n=1 Tax=Streptomyces sp. ST2-7A TaxID=2907214 RepID=UPI001F27DC6A|nr:hypothetical protein [Streptomyces sp. ST2-7A]MCE7081129.1 hypothetical protein [Streptomyces sp. ST2-7A]
MSARHTMIMESRMAKPLARRYEEPVKALRRCAGCGTLTQEARPEPGCGKGCEWRCPDCLPVSGAEKAGGAR